MAELFAEMSSKMQRLTQSYVEELINIWTKIFDKDVCVENLDKLVEHATNFYEELVTESEEKEAYVKNEIKELEREAEKLKRLLKVDFVLKSSNPHAPLLVVQSELDNSLIELREQLRLRKEEIYELLLEQESLCDELSEPPRPLVEDPLPSTKELQEFREHVQMLKQERFERTKKVATLRRDIKNIMNVLEIKVQSDAEDHLLNDDQIRLSKESVSCLNRMLKYYGNQVQEVREKIEEMKGKLKTLWDRLDTSPNTRNKFMRYTDYTQSTYDAFYGELNRCQTLKSQNIKMYVNQIRQEILQWWDKTLKSEVQRSRFSNYYNHCYTDDLLVLHEMELEDLKLFYESNKEIFELFENRKLLWERMNALEAKSSEPGRYNNRGGQLLKEEKERKMIATKLPKIEQQLTELVKRYEEREQKNFLVYGKNILEVMAQEWAQKREAKELLSSARKHAQTPSCNRSMRTASCTPMSARNATTASSIRKTPTTASKNQSTLSLATKRKMNTAEKVTPVAKRSLIYAMSSPSVFLKPTRTAVRTPYKSPLKKIPRVIGSTIRRRSGRRSNGVAQKRRSIQKAIETASTVSSVQHDDTYNSFENCIEPASRSSIKPTFNGSNAHRVKRMRLDASVNTCKRIARQLPQKTPPGNTHSTSTISSNSSRKLTTKNLPIMI